MISRSIANSITSNNRRSINILFIKAFYLYNYIHLTKRALKAVVPLASPSRVNCPRPPRNNPHRTLSTKRNYQSSYYHSHFLEGPSSSSYLYLRHLMTSFERSFQDTVTETRIDTISDGIIRLSPCNKHSPVIADVRRRVHFT